LALETCNGELQSFGSAWLLALHRTQRADGAFVNLKRPLWATPSAFCLLADRHMDAMRATFGRSVSHGHGTTDDFRSQESRWLGLGPKV
jgi:hypothetical protein